MVKASPLIEAVNAGELSPRMDARVSFDKYAFGLSRSLNTISMPQGGSTTRPGTRMISPTKSGKALVYGIEPASGVGYMLECGGNYIRFYKNQTQLVAPTVASVITNGNFGSNITNWTDRSTGTATISWDASQKMALNGTLDGYAWAEQSITVAGGDQGLLHIFKFTLSGDPGATATVQIGTVSKGYDLYRSTRYGIGQHMVAVTPGTSPIFFQIINTGTERLLLDSVSILTNTPIELAADYSISDIDDLRFVQSNDVFYMFNAGNAIRRLERHGDYSWSLVVPFFTDGPYGEINPDIDLDAAQLVKNPGLDGGLGEFWDTSYNNASVEFDGTQGVVFFYIKAGASGQFALARQHVTTPAGAGLLHIMHFQAVGKGQVTVKVGTAAGGSDIVTSTNYDAGWYTIAFTPGGTSFWVQFGVASGVQSSEDVPGFGGVFIYTERANTLQASATTGSVMITARADFRPFAATDVGRSIRLEHAGRESGWGVITAFTDDQHVTVKVYRTFASTQPTETWRFGAWSETTGYPACGILYQQRLIGGNTTAQPQSFWASQSGDFQNMRPDSWVGGAVTTEDDDAFSYTLGAKKGSPIRWFGGTRKLIVGTAAGQWIASSKGVVLTPQDIALEADTSVRAAAIDSVEIDTVAIFIERDRLTLNDLGYDYQIDGFRAADLNILADHIGGASRFKRIVYQAKPYSLVWALKDDGTLGCLVYKREQQVVGWTAVTIAGVFGNGGAVVESTAAIPGNTIANSQVYNSDDRDEVWLVVKRTINGSTVRHIEVMEGFFRGPNRALYDTQTDWLDDMLDSQADAFYVDCGITYSGVATTTITGLSHLEGQSVYVNGNGRAQGPFTVSGGQITGLSAVTKAHVGLRYSWKMRGLKMNFGAQSGSSVGQTKMIGAIKFVLLDSGPFQYGAETTGEKGRDAIMVNADKHMPVSGALFTGEAPYDKPEADFDSDPRFVLTGSGPLPFTFLAVAPKVATNEV